MYSHVNRPLIAILCSVIHDPVSLLPFVLQLQYRGRFSPFFVILGVLLKAKRKIQLFCGFILEINQGTIPIGVFL